MSSEIEVLRRKVEELEDEVYKKREQVAAYVFNHLTDEYGTDPKGAKRKMRDAVLTAFGLLHANWRSLDR